VNFDFSDEQKALQDAVSRLLANHPGLSSARRALNGEALMDRALWQALGRDGWLGAHELGYETLCLIAEAVGRSMAAIPFSSSAVLFTDALVRGGSDAQRTRCLPALMRGERIGAVAWVGDRVPSFRDGRLDGQRSAVMDGQCADWFLVLADVEGKPGFFLVAADAPGLQCEPQDSLDPSHAFARLTLVDVPAEPLPGLQDARSVEALFQRTAVVLAFEQIGAADAALELATNYAKARMAFGRPIGSFQAVKHKLADVYIANQLARANAYYGAWALESQAPQLALAAAVARVSATEALNRAARESIQVHGGVAVTWQHDAHLFYRRSQCLALMLGGLREWQSRLVDACRHGDAHGFQ
jgi:acyl-CoA dehydrogenase